MCMGGGWIAACLQGWRKALQHPVWGAEGRGKLSTGVGQTARRHMHSAATGGTAWSPYGWWQDPPLTATVARWQWLVPSCHPPQRWRPGWTAPFLHHCLLKGRKSLVKNEWNSPYLVSSNLDHDLAYMGFRPITYAGSTYSKPIFV